jgi:hypothetical protein
MAVMRTRLQRDIGGRPARRRARLGQRLRLGMGTAALGRPPAPDHDAIRRNDHTADRRIRRDFAERSRRQHEGVTHMMEIGG